MISPVRDNNKAEIYLKMVRKKDGFSLIEMLVVVSIVIIITSVILTNLPSFGNRTSVDLAAEQMATIIREAQVYGISQKKLKVYSVSFDSSVSSQFKVFADSDETVYALPKGITIEKTEAKVVSDYESKTPVGVTFQYRYPEPKCFTVEGTCTLDNQSLKITLKSTRDNKRKSVEIYQNGQIAVVK